MVTKYQQHVEGWINCDACDLCQTRRHVVLLRGKIPSKVLYVGESPGPCITGDSLIEVAGRDVSKSPKGIPIKNLVGKKNFLVYSYDTVARKLAIGKVKWVKKIGIKPIYLVSYFWWGAKSTGGGGREKYYGQLKVTSNHPFLLKSGGYLTIDDGLAVGDRLQPFYRNRNGEYQYVGTTSEGRYLEHKLLMERKVGRVLTRKEEVHHKDKNKRNNLISNLELLSTAEHARLHGLEDNAMFNPEHRVTHKCAVQSKEYRANHSRVMKERFKDPEVRKQRKEQNQRVAHKTSATLKEKYKDPLFYYNYLIAMSKHRGHTPQRLKEKFKEKFPKVEFPPEENHQIYAIEPVGKEVVYDMEVGEYHNFAVNGIFVHNSEDSLGVPFIGPAGKLLDQITTAALTQLGKLGSGTNFYSSTSFAYTNLIACFPLDDDGTKFTKPPKYAIDACADRLQECFKLVNPKLVVWVGDDAKKYGPKSLGLHKGALTATKFVHITHPGAILRAKEAAPLIIKRSVVVLRDALEKVL